MKYGLAGVVAAAILIAGCGSKSNVGGGGDYLLAPLLYAPADSATGCEVSMQLKWAPVSQASMFEAQVSLNSSFTQIIDSNSMIIGDSVIVPQLPYNTQCFWHVRSKNSAGVSIWSGAWHFTTRTAWQGTPVAASPTNGDTGISTSPVLTWNQTNGAMLYHLQVSTNSQFANLALNDSMIFDTSMSLGTLSGGTVYYWRVSAFNNNLIASDYSDVRHFRTRTVSAGTPVLVSPANADTAISASPTLIWKSVSGAATYHLQVSTNALFATTVFNDPVLTDTAQSVGALSRGTIYYWRVASKIGSLISDYSDIWHFKTSSSGQATVGGMRLIAGGTFPMGSDSIQNLNAQPVHLVTVSSFYIDTTEVTQRSFLSLMGQNPSVNNQGVDLLPVENVTWFDAVLYCNKRSKRDGLDSVYSYNSIIGTPGNGCSDLPNLTINYAKKGYRLPTEAEWEYAATAGYYDHLFYWQGDSNNLACDWDVANSNGTTHPVATKIPNAYGLYDMLGNVYEWVGDWFEIWPTSWPADSIPVNPHGPATGDYKQMRGGAYINLDEDIWLADRDDYTSPSMQSNRNGFRCVKSQ